MWLIDCTLRGWSIDPAGRRHYTPPIRTTVETDDPPEQYVAWTRENAIRPRLNRGDEILQVHSVKETPSSGLNLKLRAG